MEEMEYFGIEGEEWTVINDKYQMIPLIKVGRIPHKLKQRRKITERIWLKIDNVDIRWHLEIMTIGRNTKRELQKLKQWSISDTSLGKSALGQPHQI